MDYYSVQKYLHVQYIICICCVYACNVKFNSDFNKQYLLLKIYVYLIFLVNEKSIHQEKDHVESERDRYDFILR